MNIKKLLLNLIVVSFIAQPVFALADQELNLQFIGAIDQAQPSVVIQCLTKGVDTNQKLINNQTPLMYAISKLVEEESLLDNNWKNFGLMVGLTAADLGLIFFGIPLFKNRVSIGALPLGKQIFNNATTQEFQAMKTDPSGYITNNGAAISFTVLKLIIALGGIFFLSKFSYKYIKKSVRSFAYWLKKVERIEIIDKLIDYPSTDVTLAVNGVTALSMIEELLKKETNSSFKNTLKNIEKQIQDKIENPGLRRFENIKIK